jgi:soluble lytic murein transglycosylase-like protein
MFTSMKILSILFTFLIAVPAQASAQPRKDIPDMKIISRIESSNDPGAIGKLDEVGLFQLRPAVLADFNRVHSTTYPRQDLFDATLNHRIAVWYMNWIAARPGVNSTEDMIIAWNWGIGNYRNWVASGRAPSDLPAVTWAYLKKYREACQK